MSITRRDGKPRLRKLAHPPKTRRHCDCCGKTRKFEYDHHVLHSACVVCGWRRIPGIVPRPESDFAAPYVSSIPARKKLKVKFMNCPSCNVVIPSNAKHHKPCGWWIAGVPRDPPTVKQQ